MKPHIARIDKAPIACGCFSYHILGYINSGYEAPAFSDNQLFKVSVAKAHIEQLCFRGQLQLVNNSLIHDIVGTVHCPCHQPADQTVRISALRSEIITYLAHDIHYLSIFHDYLQDISKNLPFRFSTRSKMATCGASPHAPHNETLSEAYYR